jgi:FKBP-type peptidyl-prolyl cis-trans isomerase FkpA
MYRMKKYVIAVLVLLLAGCSEDNVLSYDDQLKKDLKAIDAYLEKNSIVATEDISGLRLVIVEVGTGLFPVSTSKLTVKYKGLFLNGTVFDESRPDVSGQIQPFQTPLSGLIEGWKIAFGKYIAKGGKATLYVPSVLAYGRAGRGSIPSNANLIFEVELIGFTN